MIRECVGFVEKYISYYGTKDKTPTQFLIDDIFLSSSQNNYFKNKISKNNSESSSEEDSTIFIFVPFEKSDSNLKIRIDGISVVKKSANVSDMLNVIPENSRNSDLVSNDLISIINNPDKHISIVADNNKRIGGSQGLSSSVIYILELAKCAKKNNTTEFSKGSLKSQSLQGLLSLSKGDYPILKSRLEKFVYEQSYDSLSSLGLNSIGPALSEWLYSDSSKSVINEIQNLSLSSSGGSIFIVNLIPSSDSSSIYSKIREEYLRQKVFNNDPKDLGICSSCGKSNCPVESPESLIGGFDKKRFLSHPTMFLNQQSKPILICHNCALKYSAFFGLLKKWRIKIFPLFINSYLQEKEIRLINEKGVNTFSQIFNQLNDLKSSDFYLILFTNGELKYFDYVCNYNWLVSWKKNKFGAIKLSRRDLERKFYTAMGLTKFDYFSSDLKGLDNLQSYFHNSFSEKVFNFVYRNTNGFTRADILRLCVLSIENLALNSKDFSQSSMRIQACLDMWFNQKSLLIKSEGLFMSIEELRKSEPIGNSLERWSYCAGRSYRFLVSKRASGASLELEEIVRAHNFNSVKNALIKKMENRSYALKDDDLASFKLKLAELLAFDNFGNSEFMDFKPYFYAGYVDELKHEVKKKGGDSNE